MKIPISAGLLTGALFVAGATGVLAEDRNSVEERIAGYSTEFFDRHNEAFEIGAAIHFSHSKAHDFLQLTPLSKHQEMDAKLDTMMTQFLVQHKAKTEPVQEYYAPYTARMAWRTLQTIDWTHALHEMTYDVMSDSDIAWNDKGRMLGVVTDFYQKKQKKGVPRSPAPLDVTMRRAGVMMKPYFTYFRNYYPRSSNFFFAAHWWHPTIYEAQMLGGNDAEQDQMVMQTDQTFYDQVLKERPLRMLLSREMMPRYSKLSPESANAFDNLHMLHGIVYDIMAYEGYTPAQKKAEMYRVIEAMSFQPGDEKLARKFETPYPDMDPRVYKPWMQGIDGDMNHIMREMMIEMLPMMFPALVPEGVSAEQVRAMSMDDLMARQSAEQRDKFMRLMTQFKAKMTPNFQTGERQGSLHDTLMAESKELGVPMQMNPMMMEGLKPGNTPQMMVQAMLNGWQAKHGSMPDIAPYPMNEEPSAPPMPERVEVLPTGRDGGEVADRLVHQNMVGGQNATS